MTPALLRVALLGPLELSTAAGPVEVGGARLRGLLARLALDAGPAVSGDALVDAVWGDDAPADQANALQSLVSRLRRAAAATPRVLESRAGRLPARRRPGRRRRAALRARWRADGRGGAAPRRAGGGRGPLRDALALWRGPALADVADAPFAAAAGGPARGAAAVGASRTGSRPTCRARAAAGPDVVAELEALTPAHPLRERLAALLISALRDAGRQAEALAAYEQVRARAGRRARRRPVPELQELHLAVLRGEAARPRAGRRRPDRAAADQPARRR